MQKTAISWTDVTWNPVRGRSKVELIEKKLQEPLHWRKPRRVFVNSMSDLFHESLPDADILSVFQTMGKCPAHTFQILTKRPERMLEFLRRRHWRNLGHSSAMGGDHYVSLAINEPKFTYEHDPAFLPNVWLGVSVEDRKNMDRIELLRETPAALRFLSLEPLLEDLGRLDLTGIGWVICGGESGPGARPFDLAWARNTRDQCREAGVPFFMKQVGAHPILSVTDLHNLLAELPDTDRTLEDNCYRLKLRDRKGGTMEEWAEDMRIRQFPEAR